MNIDNRIILIVISCLTLLLFPVTAFSSGVPRIILGFLCLLFFTGYALVSALVPQKATLTTG